MLNNLLTEDITQQIQEIFDNQLMHPVEIIFFSKPDTCESCGDTHQLLAEIASLSTKLHLSIHDIKENPELAQQYDIELAPGLVIAGREKNKLSDFGIRFSGIPSGYEFSSLIHSILMVSKRDSGLKPETRKELKGLSDPVNLKVFVTPT
jgi:alkyl hydroperoxide reductase subunit AhpF